MLKIFQNFFKRKAPTTSVPDLERESINQENGFNNDILYDPTNDFDYFRAPCEKVIDGQNNTYIVLGRDRPGGIESGYGSKGHFKCGAIDIVAGRLSSVNAVQISSPSRVDSNTGADASRVYLSQKADIDDYYSIAEGKTGRPKGTAAIAIKSDEVRIIARNSLKLVTNTDEFLSNGNRSLAFSGVQLIAKNDDSDMQPIPKGDNLEGVLKNILAKIAELNKVVFNFMEIQKDFNAAMQDHTHISTFPAEFTSISPEASFANLQSKILMRLKVEQGLTNNRNNLVALRSRYLSAGSDFYINSMYHYLN